MPPRAPHLVATLAALATIACAGGPITVQTPTATGVPQLAATDTTLVERILLAEDGRDASDGALAEGVRHADPRVRLLARRALGRIRDPHFAARDSFPVRKPLVDWPEPAWRLRYRALVAPVGGDCSALRTALADSVWHVRLRAADLVMPACATDHELAATLRTWIDVLGPDASSRSAGGVAWQAAAHAAVALASARPAEARPRVRALASHPQWQLRAYAARAAGVMADTTTLRRLAVDANDNVKEVAIERLSRLTGHADDNLYLAALDAAGAQAVRAAALALVGSPRDAVPSAASATFERWVAHVVASERDARVALLQAAGRPATDDRPPARRADLAPGTAALALGHVVTLRVRMAPTNGGGSFVVRLRGDVAPIMAARILTLAKAGYYDRLTWHRVEPDFVIQGGSPGSNEYVGSSRFLRDELGTLPHPRGVLGMSTRGHDTGDAQWFVNLKDNARLGADYTAFAEVVEGMDVVDGVLEGDEIASIEVIER